MSKPESMRELLTDLGLINPDKLVMEWDPRSPSARFGMPSDDELDPGPNFVMLKDVESGIIFLEGEPAMDYVTNPGLSYWDASTLAEAREKTKTDDERRISQLAPLIQGKRILEFGCGNGGFISRAKGEAVEIQADAARLLRADGLTIHDQNPRAGSCEPFDVVVSFHVLEHLTDPIGTLRQLHAILKPGGKIVLEVPHAKDFLQEFLNLDCFRAKSYRGEHLLLHTDVSLRKFLEVAGFRNIIVQGYQRHSMNNHLYYAVKRTPAATMQTWDFLLTPTLKREYAATMERIGMTDTLIAVAEA